ncbi:MAG: metallophosphoesterase family protein [Clostridia bacterium]
MKICVFSDSHGSAGPMISAIGREKPDLCFFLGDGERDLAAVQARFPALPFYAVRGNCDWRSSLSGSLVCTVGGVCIFAAHGHTLDVKYEPALDSLLAAAKEAGASLALFGHTHRALLEEREGITLLNPGSIGRGAHPSYAVLQITDGACTAKLIG